MGYVAAALGLAFAHPSVAMPEAAIPARFLSQPSVRGDLLAFVYQGEIWTAHRSGGAATQRTFDGAPKSDPRIAPDGRAIAYTAYDNGNRDVFVVALVGGAPRRLTSHPADDHVLGWSHGGASLLVASARHHPFGVSELFEVPAGGGAAVPISIGQVYQAAPSPSGDVIAITRTPPPPLSWRRYRGGQAAAIHIVGLGDHSERGVPHTDANDTGPLWVRGSLYFRSDRSGSFGIYRYDPAKGDVAAVLVRPDLDVDWLAGDDDGLIFAADGLLFRYDIASGRETALPITVGTPPASRPARIDVSGDIERSALAPDGRTLAIEARGDIFVKRPGSGAVNLTATPASAERAPVWSPDGKRIAFVSDGGGCYAIVVRPASGEPGERRMACAAGMPFGITWSPDGRHLAYLDRDYALKLVEVASGAGREIASRLLDAQIVEWAPDSSGIFYVERLATGYGQARFASLDSLRPVPLTSPDAHVRDLKLRSDGRALYVIASRDAGPAISAYDVSPTLHIPAVAGQVYEIALGTASGPAHPGGGAAFEVDPADIFQRARLVPSSRGRYPLSLWELPAMRRSFLATGDGATAILRRTSDTEGKNAIWSLDLLAPLPGENDALRPIGDAGAGSHPRLGEVLGIASQQVSAAPGKHLLLFEGRPIVLTLTGTAATLEAIEVGPMQVDVAPSLEWRQMYDEVAHAFRDYFLDEDMRGNDWDAKTRRYRRWLADVRSRGDLAYVIAKLLGELGSSHLIFSDPTLRAWGADAKIGLLGADVGSDGQGYVVRRILQGSPWSGDRSPFGDAGVRPGDRLLAVEGEPLLASQDLFERLRGRAGQPTRFLVRAADGSGERTIDVRPLASDLQLRRQDWIEKNRRLVAERSHGAIAYIYQSDTSETGLGEFIRDFYSQSDRRALILDERFNDGGADSDYQLDVMGRTPFVRYQSRGLPPFRGPGSMIDGPKVMIVNAEAGSGGDLFPLMFKTRGLGHVIGTRTWGGFNGYYRLAFDPDSVPHRLIDGTEFVVPDLRTLPARDDRTLENHGFDPDETVEIEAADYARGEDPQLSRAIDYLNARLGAQ